MPGIEDDRRRRRSLDSQRGVVDRQGNMQVSFARGPATGVIGAIVFASFTHCQLQRELGFDFSNCTLELVDEGQHAILIRDGRRADVRLAVDPIADARHGHAGQGQGQGHGSRRGGWSVALRHDNDAIVGLAFVGDFGRSDAGGGGSELRGASDEGQGWIEASDVACTLRDEV